MPAVYQYLWRDYSFPLYRGWILTLKNSEAVVFVAFITIFITYTQSRAWRLERDIFLRWTSPKIQLPTANVNRVLEMSQGTAINTFIKVLLGRKETDMDRLRLHTYWIGLVALINIAAFVAIGVILPWSLVNGYQPSLVRSAITEECVNYPIYTFEPSPGDRQHKADLFYRQCWEGTNKLNIACRGMNGMLTDRPTVGVSRDVRCPFQETTCLQSPRPVVFEYKDLTFRDYGLNSRSNSEVYINHRITCAHLTTSKFINVSSETTHANKTIASFFDWSLLDPPEQRQYAIEMYSFNDLFSIDWERLARYADGSPYSLPSAGHIGTRLKTWPDTVDFITSYDPQAKLHPDLRRDDGVVFVAILDFVGGKGAPVDAQFPAVGCVEQYQFCKRNKSCTTWGAGNSYFLSVLEWYREMGQEESALDVELLYNQVISKSWITESLKYRWDTLTGISVDYTGTIVRPEEDNTNTTFEPWMERDWSVEIRSWFETAFVLSRYSTYLLPERGGFGIYGIVKPTWSDIPNSICDRLLFSDSDYTNFDFVQFLVIQIYLHLVCIASARKKISVVFLKLRLLGQSWISIQEAYGRSIRYLIGHLDRRCKTIWYTISFRRQLIQMSSEQVLRLDELRIANQQQESEVV